MVGIMAVSLDQTAVAAVVAAVKAVVAALVAVAHQALGLKACLQHIVLPVVLVVAVVAVCEAKERANLDFPAAQSQLEKVDLEVKL